MDSQGGSGQAQPGVAQAPRAPQAPCPVWMQPQLRESSSRGEQQLIHSSAGGDVAPWDGSVRSLSWLVSQQDTGQRAGDGEELGARTVHRPSFCERGRAAQERGYFDRVWPAMRVNRKTLKSCSSASTGSC